MRQDLLVRITGDPIGPQEATAFVADPGAGGTCAFLGTVRDHSSAGQVTGLTYEAWRELAERRLEELGEDLFSRWTLRRVAVLHRVGDLAVGEVSVAIAVRAAHRAEAFEACRPAIERLKHDVPIWKQEHLVTGESAWVMGS
jgi:molybdopterin synthase catalytic subunit